ncbi:MAG: peptidylprolyl isomerase, partial [Bacteroidaceae bacterium]|nr:peptidylprolyl isomerase [Bacteroidaceae bacterium]
MKKIASLAAGLMFATSFFGQSEDPVLMKINGKSITRSEFEYSFNKNNSDGVLDKKDVESYVQLFVDFKLKVAAAEEARIDTLPAIKKELRGYKEQMLLPTLVDNDFIEREARKTYDNTAARFAGQDLLKASHILVLLQQNASAEQEKIAKARIDSIYAVLKNGADFAQIAKAHSDYKGSAVRVVALCDFGKGMMIPDFEKA